MEELAFVTGNINKGYEMAEKFNRVQVPLEIIQMDFQEPVVNDIEVVSKSKVIQAYQILKRPCFVIDSGFNIHNYPNNPGYPGAYVRRSGISENIDELLNIMKDVKDRTCQFLDCLTFYDGEDFYCFYGIDEGILAYEKRGIENRLMRSALWYVFMPNGFSKTLAEMTDEERRNRKGSHISAKEQFINWYKNEYKNIKKLVKEKDK